MSGVGGMGSRGRSGGGRAFDLRRAFLVRCVVVSWSGLGAVPMGQQRVRLRFRCMLAVVRSVVHRTAGWCIPFEPVPARARGIRSGSWGSLGSWDYFYSCGLPFVKGGM